MGFEPGQPSSEPWIDSEGCRGKNTFCHLVEPMGFEPTTSSMPSRRAPNCATAPPGGNNWIHTTSGRALRLEYRAYGQTHFSGRRRVCHRLEVLGGIRRQTAPGGLRTFSGESRTEGPQLESASR